MTEKTNKKILIAEDEKSYSRALVLKLKNNGFEVDLAENGEDVLKMLKKKKYDLLLLDLIMPKMNGFSVLESINKNKIKTKVIVISNLSQTEDEKKAKKLGAYGYIVKANISIVDVISKVQKTLKK